jgi:hypothetical protein
MDKLNYVIKCSFYPPKYPPTIAKTYAIKILTFAVLAGAAVPHLESGSAAGQVQHYNTYPTIGTKGGIYTFSSSFNSHWFQIDQTHFQV